MSITLYFIVTRLPDSLSAVRDHFLALDPIDLTVDLLEKHLLAAETSVVALGAARGTPRTPFFEGCSPSPLAPSYTSAAAVDILGAEDVKVASALVGSAAAKGQGWQGWWRWQRGWWWWRQWRRWRWRRWWQRWEWWREWGLGGGGGGSGGGGGRATCGSGGGGSGGGRGGAIQRGGSGGGQRQQQQRRSKTPTPLQLREWFAQRGAPRDSVRCPYVIRTGDRAGQTCGKPHTQNRCFSRLDDAWCAEFGDEAERPRWAELLRSGVAIFDLDNDAIVAAMYALSVSAQGDCYLCVLPDPGIEAVALGARESALPGTAPAEALHTFTLDSGASRCFFRDSTTLTPLSAPVPVRLADPSGGPVLACSSTVLPCPAVPSRSPSSLHLPSFSTNLVSTAALQDAMVTTTTPGGQHVSICKCTRTRRHLATFTCRPRSSMYTLTTEPPQVAAFAQVSASGPVAAPCSCRLLSHQTLLWHHRLGHPSLPRLRGMHSRLLVSGLPRSLPPLPPSPAPPCLPCVEGRQHAAPHSSSSPPTTAPLQTLHMDVWGPACVSGQGRERYFLLVVDVCTRYTTVFHLLSKGQVPYVLIPWIRAVRLQLRERFHEDLPVLPLHSDRGGDFSSDLLRDLCRGEGILQSFTLPASPQKNGVAEHCIGLVMEVARTSMIHAAAPHFLWPFDVTFDKSVPFYYLFTYRTTPLPPLCRSSLLQVPLCAARGALSGGAEPASAEPGGAEPEGAEPGGAEYEGAESGGAEPGGAEHGGTKPEGAEPGGVESEGAESGGAEPRGTASAGGPAGASPRLSPRREPLSPQQLREWFAQRTRLRSGPAGAGGSAAGGTGAGVAGAAGPGGARTRGTKAAGSGGVVGTGARDPGARDPGARGTGAGGAGAGTGARDFGAGGTGAGGRGAGGAGAGAGDPGAGGAGAGGAGGGGTGAGGPGAGGTLQRRPFFVPPPPSSLPPPNSVLCQVLSLLSSTGLPPNLLSPPTHQSQPQLQPDSPLPAPSRYVEQTCSFTERHEPESRPASPVRAVRTGRRVPCPRPPPVPGPRIMALRPSSFPLRPHFLPFLTLTTVVTDPSFESTAASALVAELVDFAAACRLDYATSLVAESRSDCPPSIGGECALGTNVLEDRQEDFECLATAVPHLVAMLLALEGDPNAPDIPTPRSYEEAITSPYSSQCQTAIDAVPLFGVNVVDGMWIFRVKQPPGSPPVFKARYVARDFSQRQGVDFFHTFSPTPKMTTLWVLLHIATQRDYELHSLEFSTAFLQGSPHEEIWLRRPAGFTGSFPADASWVDDLATQRSSQGYTFSLGSGSVSWRSTRSSSVLSFSCEAEIYVGAMVAQELRWLTYLLNDLGEQPRSSPVLSMIALCQEHRPEHRTKHIGPRYFLARELQQRGQLHLAYVATRASTSATFTKALQSGQEREEEKTQEATAGQHDVEQGKDEVSYGECVAQLEHEDRQHDDREQVWKHESQAHDAQSGTRSPPCEEQEQAMGSQVVAMAWTGQSVGTATEE
ncbi:unnamed protein product [Closterium sp. NIES-54]